MPSLTMADLAVGDAVESRKTISESDVYLFAGITGDFNPVHVDAEYARGSRFGARVAHGPLTSGLAAGLIGMRLPGVGTVAVSMTVRFRKPVYIGDTVATRAEVAELDVERGRATIGLIWRNQDEEVVAEGETVVMPPSSPEG